MEGSFIVKENPEVWEKCSIPFSKAADEVGGLQRTTSNHFETL